MFATFRVLLYKLLIDPLLEPLHRAVLKCVKPTDCVIDIACGTGILAMYMAQKACFVTGIDLSEESITAAKRTARRRGADNVRYEIRDAGNLACYGNKEFDLAVTSMAIHQFDPALAVRILAEMRRIARRVVIADYNHHMPRGWGRSLAWAIERAAGGDHYRNFRNFMQQGGIPYFARHAGICPDSASVSGGGVFMVAVSECVE